MCKSTKKAVPEAVKLSVSSVSVQVSFSAKIFNFCQNDHGLSGEFFSSRQKVNVWFLFEQSYVMAHVVKRMNEGA
jgi:hypothetical protein